MINVFALLATAALMFWHSFVKSLVPGKDFIVVLICVLLCLSGLLGLLVGGVILIGTQTVAGFVPQELTVELNSVGTPVLGWFVISISAVTLLVAVGIWYGRRWGRHGALVISAIALIYSGLTFSLIVIGDIVFYSLMLLLVAVNWKKLRAVNRAADDSPAYEEFSRFR
jgi:hypothetical protein